MTQRLPALFLLATVLLAVGATAQTSSPSYPDFSNSSTLQINAGAATVASDGAQVLRVSPNDQNQRGSAFTRSPIDLTDESSFSTAFSFRFSSQGSWSYNGETGGDGLVFVVQTVSNSAGSEGGGIGYDGISNSVGIEFDSWHNEQDPDRSHVGINIGGSVASAVTRSTLTPGEGLASLGDLDDGQVWYAWVDYDGSADRLEVRVAKSDSRPGAPFLSYTVDLLSELGSEANGTPKPAFVGFTSATGSASAHHDVLSWSFENQYDPIETVPGPTAEAPANACAALPGANSWGDVHISTPDGTVYDFQAAGEFLLLASNDGGVVVQSRQLPWENNPRVTVNKAVAMNVGGTRVGVYLEPGPVVYVGDTRVEVASGTPTVLPGGGSICEVGGGGTASYRVTWANGFAVGVRAFAGSHIDVGVTRGGGGSMAFSGLIGDLDGDASNDMRVRGGSVLTAPLGFEALYGQFGTSWRITSSESLFRYAGGTSTSSYNQGGTPAEPFLLTDLNPAQRESARAACVAAGVTTPALLGGCTLDVGATGSTAFTASAVSAEVTVQTAGATFEGGMVGGGATMFPLLAGTDLVQGQRYYNAARTHYMVYQADGNVVVYTAADGYVWGLESVTSSYGQITRVSVTADGNFVAYGSSGVIWSALESGAGARARLGLTERGVLQLRAQQTLAWTSRGGGGGASETIEVDGTEILTGDVQVTLQWDTPVDLDLYVTDPNGDEVSYLNTSVSSGGILDVDARRSCAVTPETVENIVWTGTAPQGAFGIRVNYYTACDQGPTAFTVTLRRGGEVVETWTGTLSYSESATYEFSN